jgi:NAD(P)-dependent dehydrogenase (short-subunit alcohol dehydrogenase family)
VNNLESKTIFISGASSGLGHACARMADEAGARLVLVGRRPDTLHSLFPDQRHTIVACDVGDESAVQALIASLKYQSLVCDGWVLAAGIQAFRPVMMETHKTLSAMWAANMYGSLGLLAAALKAKLVARGGSIVLFSSAAARSGGPGLASYAASKAALEGAARSLALELAPQQMRVNAVAAGIVRTPMTDKYLALMTEEQAAALERQHPLGFGTPDDVAGPVMFLLSPAARWITGTVLTVDGGLCAQ